MSNISYIKRDKLLINILLCKQCIHSAYEWQQNGWKFLLFYCHDMESDVTLSENCLSVRCGGCDGGRATDGRHLKHSEPRHRARRWYPIIHHYRSPLTQPIRQLALPTCPPVTKNSEPIHFKWLFAMTFHREIKKFCAFFVYTKTNRVSALPQLGKKKDLKWNVTEICTMATINNRNWACNIANHRNLIPLGVLLYRK